MIRRNWPDVLDRIFNIRRVTWTFLSEHAQVLDYDGTRLLLGLSTKGLATTFRNGPHGEVVRQALSEALGIDTRVEGIPASDAPPSRGGGGGGAGPSGPPGAAPSAPSRSGGGQGGARRDPVQGAQSEAPQGPPASGPPRGRPQHDPRGGAPGGDEHAGGPRADLAHPGGEGPTGAGCRSRGESAPGPNQRRTSGEQGAHRDPRGQQPGRAPARGARDVPPGDDVPPPGDDDVPPEEESLPPDPGQFGGRAQASRPSAPARGADPAHGRGAPSGAQPDARDAGDGTGPAGRPQRPAEQTEVAGPGDDAATRPAHPGAQEARAAIRAARGRIPAGPPTDGRGGADATPDRARADRSHDDGASVDDEDIADAGLVGQPVIADVLGGVVISDEES
ncbi:hypothetical protein [Mobilicoccus caccae]|nr:hypothetical protein [Mobilicoccus caccae]